MFLHFLEVSVSADRDSLVCSPLPNPLLFSPSLSQHHHHCCCCCCSCSEPMCAFSYDSDSWKGVFLLQLLAGSAASKRLSHAPSLPGQPVGPGFRTGTFCSSVVLLLFFFLLIYLPPSFLPAPPVLSVCLFLWGPFFLLNTQTQTQAAAENRYFFCPSHIGAR